jgi:hypothetical protein
MVYLTFYLVFGMFAVAAVRGQTPLPGVVPENQEIAGVQDDLAVGDEETSDNASPVPANEQANKMLPSGKPSQISDWALAGIVWSDACLVRKMAVEAIENADSEQQRARYLRVARQAGEVIADLEQFGWKRVGRSTGGGDQASAQPAADRDVNNNGDGSDAEWRPGIRALDTETPAGRRDPGRDDELIPPDTRIAVDNYRVDDVIDETLAEELNNADAVEDGVEKAIADTGLLLDQEPFDEGRISQRESQTRSGTLPFSYESIYDSDDYDPDVDYRAENPKAIENLDPQSGSKRDLAGDFDDDVIGDEQIEVADGEDELAAALFGNSGDSDSDAADTDSSTTQAAKPPVDQQEDLVASGDADGEYVAPSELLDRLTRTNTVRRLSPNAGRYGSDADWVQLHLDMNQRIWSQLSPTDDLRPALDLVLWKMRNSARVAQATTTDPDLTEILNGVFD